MDRDIVFWFEKKEEESCEKLFHEFIKPHLASHQELKEIKQTYSLNCEFIIKNFPICKKSDENDTRSSK